MKSLVITVILALLLITLSSCKKSNPVGSSSGEQPWPLHVGNTWVYRWTEFDTNEVALRTGYDTTIVTRDTIIAGNTWYQGVPASTSLLRNASDGVWMMSAGHPILVWKYPATVGESYTFVWAGTTYQCWVQATDTSLTVPEGTHTCHEYRSYSYSQVQEVDYLSPGTGPVVEEFYDQSNSGRPFCSERLELVSVSLE